METKELANVGDKSLDVNHMRTGRLDDSLFSKELAPHYMKLAGQLATSDLVPKSFRGKPQDLFLCWALGYQIGMSPEQAMQCIAIVNGKAVMWGDEMLALCMSHREFDDIIETPIVKNDAVIGYNCTVKRKGKADKQSVFTLEMAKKAGLLAKGGVWNQYPERMLKLRARGFCLRDAFPDALKGLKSREEVEDYIDAPYSVIETKKSRTEILKKDINNREELNAENHNEFISTDENNQVIEKDIDSSDVRTQEKDTEEKIELHSKIKRLINETGFTEERLDKALKYYEVSDIDSLNFNQAYHFFNTLRKL